MKIYLIAKRQGPMEKERATVNMLRRLLLGASVLVACQPAAHAADESIREIEPRHWFDPSVPCDPMHDERASMTCAEDRKNFGEEMQLAFSGDYTAQRNMTFYYRTGSEGAVYQNPEMACAWAMVVVVSTSPETREYSGGTPLGDVLDLLSNCETLDSGGRFQAQVIAERILSRLDRLSLNELESLREKLRN
jgi:hypothetical protein